MTTESTAGVRNPSAAGVRRAYAERFAPLAVRGLADMLLPNGRTFCDRAFVAPEGGLRLEGVSRRYGAMVAIGAAAWRQAGGQIDLPLEPVVDDLFDWARSRAHLGDAGLVLWALLIDQDARAEELAASLAARRDELSVPRLPLGSMPLGWLLTGAAEAIRRGVGDLGPLAATACDRLMRNRHPSTGLFVLGGAGSRRRPLAAAVAARLGSFASQVYPTFGLARYGRAVGNEEAFRAAVQCADRICALQGPAGQWWWIYDPPAAQAAVRYPVYGIHQDAMGPMALLAVQEAGGSSYASAIRQSLAWLDEHPELPGEPLVDEGRGVVRRAIQRDDPERTGAFGLSGRERNRMIYAAWLHRADRREFVGGHVCPQCRPYHLGWILLAAAMAATAPEPEG